MSELLYHADIVERELAALPKIEGPDWQASRERYRDALYVMLSMISEGPIRVTDKGTHVRVSGLGVSATSTCGAAVALQNWVAAARRKAGRVA
ncbi:MAG: hypothetical protein D6811_06655 [Alphaproteobacteria bacterium]|nr:MAG: hypothetical protein D6811_06655 [Alphaproteobacteria bacterium]